MSYKLTWMPEVLKTVGLKVALLEGWENRGRAEMGEVAGVICHHTVGPSKGNMPSLQTLINGRQGGKPLPGPLAQLGLGRDGTYYIIAAGRCNHAGEGQWQGITLGNSRFIGIEAENTGFKDDPWPDIQLDAYHRGVAAILRYIGRDENDCAGHAEYALPRGRKTDPSLDMHVFRQRVKAILDGAVPAPPWIPAVEPAPPSGGAGRPTLRRTTPLVKSEHVAHIQALLSLTADGLFGGKTEAAVRLFQKNHGLVPDGIIGPKTWRLLDALATT